MPRTVLIVDDERDTNDILASLVRARDFDPIQLYSGAQVSPAVSEKKPELILLDLMLPDVDGFAICDQLKRNRETNLIPIVMVTALQDAASSCRGRAGRGQRLSEQAIHARPALRGHRQGPAWHEEHLKRGTHGEINFDIRSELTYLQQANDMLADLFAHTPLTDRQIKDLKQAVMEMGGNAIEWGHRKNADLVLADHLSHRPRVHHADHPGPGAGFQSQESPACRVRRRSHRPHRAA